MYVTRRSSLFKASPEAALEPPPRGPASGYLVIQDEEYEETTRCCFGLCKDAYLQNLPFPQNRSLVVQYSYSSGETSHTTYDKVYVIPVVDQPLGSNRYYVVAAEGRHKGKIYTCSREEDKWSCCLFRCVKDIKPTPFDQHNVYQQVEFIVPDQCCGSSKGYFSSKSAAHDGFPPSFLRRDGWQIRTSKSSNCKISEALGMNDSLRERMPDLDNQGAPQQAVIVGKWYCPYMFVNEEKMDVKDQLKESMFYEMTLEQVWEEVYTSEGSNGKGNNVNVNIAMKTQKPPLVCGERVAEEELSVVNGMRWFRGLGLSEMVVERMRWEEEKWGWFAGEGVVKRVEECSDDGKWKKFTCYVLVERFVLKRMDGYVVISFDFVHTNKVKCKWE